MCRVPQEYKIHVCREREREFPPKNCMTGARAGAGGAGRARGERRTGAGAQAVIGLRTSLKP